MSELERACIRMAGETNILMGPKLKAYNEAPNPGRLFLNIFNNIK